MNHPRLGERVFVRPRSAVVPVQRAEGIYGQFLPTEGAEAIWDPYLHRRLTEGAIEWRPLDEPAPAPPEPGLQLEPEASPAAPATEPEPELAPSPRNQENG